MFPPHYLTELDYRSAANLLRRLDMRQFMAVVYTILRILRDVNNHY